MLMNKYRHWITPLILLLGACNGNRVDYDASGNFEADEVIVSAEQTGQLLSFTPNEGDSLKEGAVVGQIDVTMATLQKEQVRSSIEALNSKTGTDREQNNLVKQQLAVLQAQFDHQQKERERTRNLVKADAATQKQLDDIDAQIDQLQKQIGATRQQIRVNESNTHTANRGILSEREPLEKTVLQFDEQIRRGQIVNPLNGIVLAKYALKGEWAMPGKPLYKIANTDTLFLKAYLTGDKLPQVRLGQQVKVRIDQGKDGYKTYEGAITWISSKAEFTPKTIQTKNERANLVYAIKITVKNDGFLKIGMYGEMLLASSN